MIKHIVMWKLKDHAAGAARHENAVKAKEMLEALTSKISAIDSLEAGINANESDASYDLALYSSFSSWEALDDYQKHPEHLKVADFISEIRAERVVADYEA